MTPHRTTLVNGLTTPVVAVTLLPMSERILLNDCGHYPHWEQPDAFAASVEGFLLEGEGT